ncbi:MAG: hypothetical protein KDB79_16080, partial [Acidobacteria bacterium]|nr:hypothetical protein [Acidobacteriota bacterium]
PLQILSRWNWKSAMLGAILRAFFYFAVYKASKESFLVTITAMIVEFSFRFFTSGASGALVQSFRRATPAWFATLIVTVSLPVISHTIEYSTHYIQEAYFANVFAASENNARQKAFAISVLFSVLSAMFNIFVMRNGVLLVGAGEETNSFSSDLKKIPRLILEFTSYLPIKMIDFVIARNFINALGIFIGFGLTVGGVLGFFRGKWSWAWTTALGAWAIMFVWTIIVAIGSHFLYNRADR